MFANYGFLWEKGCKPTFAYKFCMPTKEMCNVYFLLFSVFLTHIIIPWAIAVPCL
jgi:hypothetical protein